MFQRWKWQSLYILVVIHGHDRDFAGNHPSIQRTRLDSTPAMTHDRLNYAGYLIYYYAQMSQLPTTNPDVHAEFMQGGFSVQLGCPTTHSEESLSIK